MPMSETTMEPYARVPGLFRRWELEQVVEPGMEFRIEDAGEASDGTALFAVYARGRGGAATSPRRG